MVRSERIDDPGELLALLPADDSLAWVHGGDGIVGWGRAAELRTSGPDRFAHASQWWRNLSARAVVRDDVDVPGTGLITFGSFTFSDETDGSVLVVPEVVVGRRDGLAWMTTTGDADPADVLSAAPATAPSALGRLRYADGALDPASWCATVAAAVERITAPWWKRPFLRQPDPG